MMTLTKQIIDYINDPDEGIGLDTDPGDVVVVISNRVIDETFASASENVTFITNNTHLYKELLTKYPNLKVIEGSLTQTNLPDRQACFIITTSEVAELDFTKVRNELKRISQNGWSNVLIVENDINNKIAGPELLYNIYAGSGYEYKEFSHNGNTSCVYHNPIGYNEEEINSPAIMDFIKACGEYCEVIESYKEYSVKDFLYNVQRTLVNYYNRGFGLIDSCTSDGRKMINRISVKEKVESFKVSAYELVEFLGKHDTYWSNFNPYPSDDKKETFAQSLSMDLDEIYDDIKPRLIIFNEGNLFDKQEMLWQFRFDWAGHTGDHLTFAVRAIHWKLQDLEYED